MTLRLRLTIVVAAVVAGAVIAVAGVAHFIAASELRARTDTLLLGRLHAFTEDASGTATSDEFGEAPSGAPALLVELDVVTQTLAADGTVDQTIEGQPHLPVTAADRTLAANRG